MAALDDAEPAIRVTAMKAAANIIWKTTSAIPRLIEFTRSASATEREAAAFALGQFGVAASNAVPAISSLFDDDIPRVRAAATNALLRITVPVN